MLQHSSPPAATPADTQSAGVRLPIAIETAGVSPVVSIYSDDSGDPGASIKVLTNPTTFNISTTETTEVQFDAGDYELEPGTYWIVIEKPAGSDEISVELTSDDSEDGGGAPGWSINDNKASVDSGASFDDLGGSVHGHTLQFAVRGMVGPADATLSALALRDTSDNAVALDPTFASGTTKYSATVANSVSQIKVAPTANDSNADIEYLDDGDMTLDDADTSTADVFDFDLNVGPNVIKVKVTGEDGTTTETYTVEIRRAEADLLVSNLGQARGGPNDLAQASHAAAVQFTTGSETDGYLISKVLVDMAVTSGTIPRVSIYSDSTGQPGSSLKILTNPSTMPTARTELDFGADNYKLHPSTTYWIVVEFASSSAYRLFTFFTISTAEDTGAAAGWSIGDNGLFTSTGTWSTTPSASIDRFAVKGTVAPPAVSDDASLSALALTDASDNAIALDPTFDSENFGSVFPYSANVVNAISQVKVKPTATDGNAKIRYLDNTDTVLVDADTSTPDVLDLILVEGQNSINIEVTATDGTTIRIYKVLIRPGGDGRTGQQPWASRSRELRSRRSLWWVSNYE